MNKITAIDHLKNGWAIDSDNIGSVYSDLQIGFTEEGPITEFDNLSFGFEFAKDGETVERDSYPPDGVTYVRTDQQILEKTRLEHESNEEYELYLWAENGGERYETTVTLTTAKPIQPYNSWEWDDVEKVWLAPKPTPDGSGRTELEDSSWSWDEDTLEWVEDTD